MVMSPPLTDNNFSLLHHRLRMHIDFTVKATEQYYCCDCWHHSSMELIVERCDRDGVLLYASLPSWRSVIGEAMFSVFYVFYAPIASTFLWHHTTVFIFCLITSNVIIDWNLVCSDLQIIQLTNSLLEAIVFVPWGLPVTEKPINILFGIQQQSTLTINIFFLYSDFIFLHFEMPESVSGIKCFWKLNLLIIVAIVFFFNAFKRQPKTHCCFCLLLIFTTPRLNSRQLISLPWKKNGNARNECVFQQWNNLIVRINSVPLQPILAANLVFSRHLLWMLARWK